LAKLSQSLSCRVKLMLTTGTVIRSRYKILQLLGSGGFGETYLAEDLDIPTHPKPKCAVKQLKPPNSNPAIVQIAQNLFNREAETLYRLGNIHNQIPKLFAHFEENGEFYLVQEFIDGHNLSTEIPPGKRLSEAEVVKLLQEIFEILAVVHQQNIIHRDIKPQNIMRRRQDGKIILIDFGAVKEIKGLTMNQGQVTSTVMIGTPGYMPNEQANGKPRLCSDVYAVGILGIQAITGIPPQQLPEDPKTGEVIWRNWANVSDKLANTLTKMVRYNFSQRYENAQEALQALSPRLQVKPKPQSIHKPVPQPTLAPNLSRRKVIQTAWFIVGGFVWAVTKGRLVFNNSEQKPSLPEKPSFSPEPVDISPISSPTPTQLATPKATSLQTFKFETVTVNGRGNITKRSNRQAKYFVEDLANGVTLEMVQIPGGRFLMGSPAGEQERRSNEGPQHEVTVPEFFMGKYEVTQAQYQAIMGSNPSLFKGEKLPVEQVSWNDAVEFCKSLSLKTRRTYRLPSEAQWEYACRAGTTTPFYFGETITTDLVNYNGNYTYASTPKGKYRQQATDVGSLPPNAFGLYDMHGNVWEWCQDRWHDNYQGAPTDGSAWLTGSSINVPKLRRGGSWVNEPGNCRSAERDVTTPDNEDYISGFRVVCVA
jgi:eukaryotic-like serine/threonine-protein kinase